MYVCICNAIREAEVRELVRTGVRTAEQAYEELGCAPVCTHCTAYLQEVLDEEALQIGAAPARPYSGFVND